MSSKTKTVMYQGSPLHILGKMAEGQLDALHDSGIKFDGVHTLALFHLAVGMLKVGQQNGRDMPSFASVLSIITHGYSSGSWTNEEARAFEADFMRLIESSGGHKLSKQEKEAGAPAVVSPMAPGTH